MHEIIRKIKPWMLPIAMIIGVIFHKHIENIAVISPYLIFIMLFITYCKVSFHNFRLDGSMGWLLLIQFLGSIAVYFALRSINIAIAQSLFICIFCPTATAAPVITGMLGGKIERVATFSLISNLIVALSAPILLAMMSESSSITFLDSFKKIALKVLPLLLGPLVVAIIIKLSFPKLRANIAKNQGLTFYIWAIALIIVVGNSVSFIIKEPTSRIPEMTIIAILSFAVCIIQFYLGRKIGNKYGDKIAGAQSLGQKNTILAIWLALTYLDPIASVGPACYIAWHNIVNSAQIYNHAHSRKL